MLRAPLVLAIVVLFAAATQARAPAPPVPTLRSFKDWVAGCDNGRRCTAIGMTPEDGEAIGFVHLTRDAGPGAGVRIRFAAHDDQAPRTAPIAIAIDGAAVPGLRDQAPPDDRDDDSLRVVTLSEPETRAFLAALRKGRKLMLAIDGGEQVAISLDGARAALLLIDDVQGRLGTRGALARTGDKPESVVPAAPALPRVVPRPAPHAAKVDPSLAAALRAQVQPGVRDDCEPDAIARGMRDSIEPLAPGLALARLFCNAGAYNIASRFFVIPGADLAKARLVTFAMPARDKPGTTRREDALINGEFDPATGLLGFFSKGRGLGDCGSAGEYAFDGSTFVLANYAAMAECRGVTAEFWPKLWRSVAR